MKDTEDCDDCASEELQSLRALYQGKRDVCVQRIDAFIFLVNLRVLGFLLLLFQST